MRYVGWWSGGGGSVYNCSCDSCHPCMQFRLVNMVSRCPAVLVSGVGDNVIVGLQGDTKMSQYYVLGPYNSHGCWYEMY